MIELARDERLASISPVWPRYTGIDAMRGEGAYLYGRDGRRYLDFTSGIGVTNTGHCHPRVVAAIQRQAAELLHAHVTIAYNEPMLALTRELQRVVPPSLDSFFFANSGSEAIEAGLKLARHATGRTNVIAFDGGYHGRTVGAMALTTAKSVYRVRYQPLMPGVAIAPFPYAYRYKMDEETVSAWCLAELRHLLETQSAPEETAALLIEPVLGEGGYVVPPLSFVRGLRQICDQHGILLMFDEVQSGACRTGRFFALEHFGVVPDVLLMAKGLASGMPLSGLAASRALMARWTPGSHGGTYGGNPVVAAAAAETIRVMLDEDLAGNAAWTGRYLIGRLRELQSRHAGIGEVRGLGLMVACEFADAHGEPDRETARRVRAACAEAGLLLLTCGTRDHVIRWIPPLIVTTGQIDDALDIFAAALAPPDPHGSAARA